MEVVEWVNQGGQQWRTQDKAFNERQKLHQKHIEGSVSNKDYWNPQKEMVEQPSQMAYKRAGIFGAVLVQESDPYPQIPYAANLDFTLKDTPNAIATLNKKSMLT